MSEFVRRVEGLIEPIRSRPWKIIIELTERCNNDCIHCGNNQPANDENIRRREMTTERVKGILEQAAELGYLQVNFTGGEPLLRPDFEELYLFARRLGMKVLLFTNARLITSKLAELFVRIPPLDPIEITVYGLHHKSYESVTRAPGSFPQFWHSVNLLTKRGIPFIVKFAILPQNKHEIDEFEAWAKTIPWMTGAPSYTMFLDLRDRRDDAKKNRLIQSLRLSPQDAIAVYFREQRKYRRWTSEIASKLLHPPGARLFNCAICEGQELCVDAYGRVQPCIGIRAPEMTVDMAGGVDARSVPARDHRGVLLRDARDSFTRLRELRATNPEYLRRCAACFLKGVCEQCPARSWMENGTLDTPVEYLCEMTHAMVRHLGWLNKGELGWLVTDGWERVQ